MSELHWLSPQRYSYKHSHRYWTLTQQLHAKWTQRRWCNSLKCTVISKRQWGRVTPRWCQSCFDSVASGVRNCYEPPGIWQSVNIAQLQWMTSKYCWGLSAPQRTQRYGQLVIYILQPQESGYWQSREINWQLEFIQLIINQIRRILILHFKGPEKNVKSVHRGVQNPLTGWQTGQPQSTMKQWWRKTCGQMEDRITQSDDMCTSVCLVSGHTFHFLVSSALGTLLVSVRSMRMEKRKSQKASSLYFLCI